jgi:hypothetical protein
MAAQPDKNRSWWEHPLPNTIIGAVLATALAWGFLRPEPPPPPPAPTTSSVPTSDRAAVLVDWPCMPDDRQIQVSGSGWFGDNEVEIDLPEQLDIFTHRALVKGDGSFSDRRFEVRLEDWGPLDIFVVTVRGLKSGKQVVHELSTDSSGAASCTLD